MQYPIKVSKIVAAPDCPVLVQKRFRCSTGQMISVRPCSGEGEGKTFLGIYLGDIATTTGCQFHKSEGILELSPSGHNPAMLIPDLDRIVFGFESWWTPITSEEQLREITDEDISNTWYVKALQQISGNDKEGSA
jgi:hypothetical protein